MAFGKVILAGLIVISLSFPAHPILDHALPKLSDYGFFKEPISEQTPISDVIPYTIASELFSDYAEKLRFIKVPKNRPISHNEDLSFNYPDGTFLIKTFYYQSDVRDSNSDRRLIETRLLKKTGSEWLAIPYVWNNDQTDAVLALAGDRKDVSWIHSDGRPISILYSVPNLNQCKSCHVYNNIQQPIGPKVRNLNLDLIYDNISTNQLDKWVSVGILEPFDNNSLPRTVDYLDVHDGNLDQRARAWLDINCAHCHRRGGPAETSGLYLELEETDPTALGILKPPVAAGRGSGDLKYNIVPGHAEQSIMDFRIRSLDPGIMMPELNRKLVHKEGVEIIQAWINSMPEKE
tara:strand:+ start:110 stop:1153 length:1044 start_codon:yes stop_codon:yes gene_type:complete